MGRKERRRDKTIAKIALITALVNLIGTLIKIVADLVERQNR